MSLKSNKASLKMSDEKALKAFKEAVFANIRRDAKIIFEKINTFKIPIVNS